MPKTGDVTIHNKKKNSVAVWGGIQTDSMLSIAPSVDTIDVDISVDEIGMWQWDFVSHSVNTTTEKEKKKLDISFHRSSGSAC